jgi:hypothetical protein
MLSLLHKGVKKICNFIIEDFFDLPPVSTTPVVHLKLWKSLQIFVKSWNGPDGILWGGGGPESWKNLKSKTSWHCPFKIFTLKFSNKSVQSSSCERPKTAQQTLFILIANKKCFPITLLCRKLMKKTGKFALHVVHSNNPNYSLPALSILLGIVAFFEKIYYKVPILTVFSNIGEDVQYRCSN